MLNQQDTELIIKLSDYLEEFIENNYNKLNTIQNNEKVFSQQTKDLVDNIELQIPKLRKSIHKDINID